MGDYFDPHPNIFMPSSLLRAEMFEDYLVELNRKMFVEASSLNPRRLAHLACLLPTHGVMIYMGVEPLCVLSLPTAGTNMSDDRQLTNMACSDVISVPY